MKKTLITISVLGLLTGCATLSTQAISQTTNTSERGFITVSTTANTELAPDVAEISFAVKTSDTKPENVYWVNHGAKIRYIDPLINNQRLSKINDTASKILKKNLSYNMNKYVYLDLNF